MLSRYQSRSFIPLRTENNTYCTVKTFFIQSLLHTAYLQYVVLFVHHVPQHYFFISPSI